MTSYLLLTACVAGAYPPGYATPGWPAYPVPAYTVGYQAYQPVGYQPMVMPMPMPAMPYQQVMPVGHCASGHCGQGGCGAAITCDDCGCGKRHSLFQRCRKHRCNDCELPCGHPDYKAMADCGDCKPPRCGLLSRLRNCFHKRDCCEDPCCKKPSLRDRLKQCFKKNDCCCEKPKDDCCCKPSLHERLRAFFKRCKKKDDCCCQASTSMMPPGPEPIKAPKEMPKKEEKKEDVLAPLPKGPPVHMISETPF
jgi:hypothetical protein